MGQGQDLFERFGHAAICVREGSSALCYNYGTTDFGSPPEELGWKFLRGNAVFWVSVWPEQKMLAVYRAKDRTIYRQRLAVSDSEARRIAAKLAHDARPEHREYVYHHFRDNCSTRVRDVIDGGPDHRLQRGVASGATFRSHGRRGLATETSLLVAADLLVGRGADAPLSAWEEMFLPDVLRARLWSDYGARPEVVYQRRGPPFPSRPAPTAPWPLLLAAGLSCLAAVARWVLGRPRLAAAVVGVPLGAMGLLVWSMAALSTVPELTWNEQLLVFWPTDLALPFMRGRRLSRYLALRVGASVPIALLTLLGLLRQPLLPWLVLALLPPLVLLVRANARRTVPAPAAPADGALR